MKTKEKLLDAKQIIAAVVMLAVVAVMLCAYLATRPAASAGSKTIQVEVVVDAEDKDNLDETYEIKTDEEYLRGALEQEGLIEGTESSYGLYVTSVCGIAADDSKQEWWCFNKDGEMLETGVDSTPIADGEHYEIVYTVGW